MVPLPSPTTTSAANFMMRPPLTVLETRLMETTLVIMPSSSRFLIAITVFLLSLQLQAALAGAVSQGLDTAMIHETAAVEHDLRDALFQSTLGDLFANLGSGLDVAAETFNVLVHGGRRHQSHALFIVNDLSVNVLGGAENIQARTSGGAADLAANAAMTTKTGFVLVDLLNHCLSLLTLFLALAGFAFLVLDDLALVADALALVRLGGLLGADFSGKLADLLLVDAGNGEVVGVLPLDLDVVGVGDDDLVREAQVHDQVGALLLAAQADAHDLHILRVAVHHTVDHVGDVGAGQAVQALCKVLVIGAGNQNFIALDLDGHQGMIVGIQAALGALDGDGVCCLIDSDSDAGRNDDGFSSNSRHCLLPLSYHT